MDPTYRIELSFSQIIMKCNNNIVDIEDIKKFMIRCINKFCAKIFKWLCISKKVSV